MKCTVYRNYHIRIHILPFVNSLCQYNCCLAGGADYSLGVPTAKHQSMISGTVIVAVSDFMKEDISDTIVHELGHVLGLWHVHHGISEMACTDECLERWGSLGEHLIYGTLP